MSLMLPPGPISTIRRLLLLMVCVGMAGTATELLFMSHYEDSWQLAPLFAIALALVTIAGHAVAGSRGSVLLLRAVMTVLIVAGVAGIVLHYRGSLEFQVEMDPTQSGWSLLRKVLSAKAPPTLAPGVLAQLGLLGWIYTYRHPALERREPGDRT